MVSKLGEQAVQVLGQTWDHGIDAFTIMPRWIATIGGLGMTDHWLFCV